MIVKEDPRGRQAMGEARHVALAILHEIGLTVALVMPLALRLLCVTCVVVSLAWAVPRTWLAFGGDIPALLPTIVLVLPAASALVARLGWGGLVISGAAAMGIGWLVGSVDATSRALIVGGALILVVVQLVFRRETHEEIPTG